MKLWMLVFAAMAAAPGWAEQTLFAAKEVGPVLSYSMGWVDRAGREQRLDFSLNSLDVAQGLNEFGMFDNAQAKAAVVKAMQRRAASMSAEGRTVTVRDDPQGVEIVATGMTEAEYDGAVAELQMVRKETMDGLISQQFYRKVDEGHIMPDHGRMVQRYAPAMAPLAQAVANRINTRDVRGTVDYLLGFYQSIPYDPLLKRSGMSNGAGFTTPYGLLAANLGDCDSKSVALAATLKALYPGLKMVMIYTQSHAFVGVEMAQGKNDYAMRLGGRTFVLADPVGPRQEVLGEIDDELVAVLERTPPDYKIIE